MVMITTTNILISAHRARRLRKVLGGAMRQAGIVAAAGLYALENCVERLADDHRNAKKIAYGILNMITPIKISCFIDIKLILNGGNQRLESA